jgi:hypothetical protein
MRRARQGLTAACGLDGGSDRGRNLDCAQHHRRAPSPRSDRNGSRTVIMAELARHSALETWFAPLRARVRARLIEACRLRQHPPALDFARAELLDGRFVKTHHRPERAADQVELASWMIRSGPGRARGGFVPPAPSPCP